MKKKILAIVLAMLTVLSCAMLVSCKQSEETKKYTVTFDSLGGTAVESLQVEDGKSIAEPEAPTKADDTFLYWYLDTKTIAFNFDNYVVSSNITLKARWESDVERYTITFNSRGGSQVPTQVVADYNLVQRPQDPTKAGDTFLCWYVESQSNIFNFFSRPKKDLTLKARWESDPDLYTIKYIIGDQVYLEQEIGYDGYYAVKPTNPTKENRVFVYWCLEGKDEPFDFDATEITKDITLKARFIIDTLAEGQIKFYLGVLSGSAYVDGITSSEQKISKKAGDVVSLPKLTAPLLDYEFLGWVNATTGEKYLIADYSNLNEYKFIYDGNPLVMYAIWE